MNLNKTIDLLGSMQTLLAVLGQLPAAQRVFVLGTMKCNGLDHELLSRQVVKAKHALQAIPQGNFEPMTTISCSHVPPSVRVALLNDGQDVQTWGLPVYTNEFGAFIGIVKACVPSDRAPASLKAIYEWAAAIDICWVKLDVDAAPVNGLPMYGDSDDEQAVLQVEDAITTG